MTEPPQQTITRLLILEDNPVDAELAQAFLREANIPFTATITDTRDGFVAALERGGFDLILADYALPMFDGIAALGIARERAPEVPFIFVSATLGEEIAIESLKNGATDYVLKQRPERLVPAVRRALRERGERMERRELRQQRERLIERLQRQTARLKELAEASIAIASARSLEDVLQMLTDEARHVVHARQSVTCLRDVNGRFAVSAHSSSPDRSDGDGDLATLDLDTFCRTVERVVHLDGDGVRELVGADLRGILAAPLLERDDTPVGSIMIAGKFDGAFTEEDEAVLVQLAQMASAAIQNARLYAEAQAANRAKDDFLATLAHELRTPVTAILGWVQMLGEGQLDDETSAAARHMIENSARVQAQIIEDLMDVSRIIAGKLEMRRRAVELGPLIEDAVRTFRGPAAKSSITLHSNVESAPISVWGDPTRLQQIVWNLLSNAIKFTPAGGSITLALMREQSEAVITVVDTGEGIHSEFLPHVFERYRQQDGKSTTRTHGGLGLGLAIVRHLVTMHGGSVSVESEGAGRGTMFTIRLPIFVVVPVEEPHAATSDAPSLHDVRVVLVDDEEGARAALTELLREHGADVRDVGSVAEALRVISEFNPDVVVSDIAMPGEDGYALIRRLRDLGPEIGRDIPVLAVTSYGRPDDRVRILSSGFQRYVQKPIHATELAREIAAIAGAR